MGNLTPDDWRQDISPDLSNLHPDGLILGGLREMGRQGFGDGPLVLDSHPADVGRTPWTVSDASAAARPAPAGPALNQDWTQLPRLDAIEAGEHGSGYYVYGTDDTERIGTAARGQWGRPRTMEVINAVADRLATGDSYTPLGIGNISLPTGGRFPPHRWHQDGLGVDVRPARTDSAQLPVTYRDQQYDRAATQRLIDAFHATGQVDKIYFNDPMIGGVQPSKGHDNHFHVQIKR